MKRRKSSSGGASLDSLLDTMTNVVGILVILLTVTQLGVGEAVERIKDALPEITDEDMERSKKKVEELDALLKLEKEQLQTIKELTQQKKTVNIKEQKALIEKLKKELEKLKEIQLNIESLKKEIAARSEKVKSLEKMIDVKETELADIKARLAKTPDPGPTPDAKIINLPNPRDAPQGAKPIEYVCRDGRILHVDIPLLQNLALKAIAQSRLVTAQKQVVDCDKLVKLFENRNVGNRDWRLKLKPIGGVPYLILELRKGKGATSAQLRKSSALFRKSLLKINPRQFYLNFRVWSDSYDTYLVAREYADQRGVLAGWTALDSSSEFRVPLGGGFTLTCQGYTPPPAGPKPVPPDLPPPTQRKLPGSKVD